MPGGPTDRTAATDVTLAPDDGVTSVAVASAEVQAAMQPWFGMECYQLSRGNLLSHVDLLELGDQQIVRESQYAAIHKLGATRETQCTISCCTPMPGSRLSEFSSDAATAVFFLPQSTEFDIHVPAGAMTTYVGFEQEAFLQGARALDPARWERTPSQLEVFSGVQQSAFLQGISEILVQIDALASTGVSVDPSGLQELILQSVLMNTVASSALGAAAPAKEQRRAYDVCRMARSYIAEHLAMGVTPTIPEICSVVNVAERTLQYAFRRYVGMTPLAYLRVCRLNCVRRDLLAATTETTVTTVALRYGFLHLGRFARDYKKLFGELPSQELARLR